MLPKTIKMQIAGLQKTTLIDYPAKVATTIFTRGCSFSCPFCHNPELVLLDQFLPLIDEGQIFNFLASRQGKLQGVCLTGGEPLINPDLADFIQKIKTVGFLIKLDTNGSFPKRLAKIIDRNLIDYIAMDIKAPLEKYSQATGVESFQTVKIEESIKLIMQSGVDYEFRTTVAKPIHQVKDFYQIGKLIKGSRRFFIQNFVRSKHIDKTTDFQPFSADELLEAKTIMEKFVLEVKIR